MIQNLLFIWIPKTAGTSLYSALKEKHNMSLYLDNFANFNNKGNASFGHLSPLELIKAGVIGQRYWQEARKFAVTRNPYDRFISLWKDMKRSSRILPDTTLTQFAFACSQMENRPGLYNTKHYSQCAPQVSWLLPDVKVLKFEEMDNWLPSFGIDALPHLNKGDENKDTMPVEAAQMIEKMYREDFAILNY